MESEFVTLDSQLSARKREAGSPSLGVGISRLDLNVMNAIMGRTSLILPFPPSTGSHNARYTALCIASCIGAVK